MSKNLSKRVSIVLIAMLLTMVVVTGSITLANGGVAIAVNDESIQVVDSLTIGHISDIHYFPLAHCYPNAHSNDYTTSDFYHSMTGDTKLVLESGLILAKHVEEMIADAKAGNDVPQYLVASGDLCKNGEHAALIDVANSLRYLQNEMRKIDGYENFQVFASPGNHDLYNHDGALYSQVDGSESIADTLTSAQFALVFAGLGYPDANLTGEGGAINLTDYLPEEYWSTSYTGGYQASTNATDITYYYYAEELRAVQEAQTSSKKLAKYIEMGDELHRLTFIASLNSHEGYTYIAFDSTDREFLDKSEGSLVRVSPLEFNSLSAGYKFYLLNDDGTINSSHAYSKDDVASAVNAGEHVFRSTGITHYTGGRILTECLDWAENIVSQEVGDNDGVYEETIIASAHQNVLPHWEKEDEILKDFTLFNCEYVANRLLGMGVRYVLTGHMHASDVECYTDIEGRTLYDFQTGSCVSYSSPRRYLTIERANCDGFLGEITNSSMRSVTTLKEVASDNVFGAKDWDQSAFDTAYNNYRQNPTDANWNAVIDTNPEYLTYIVRYDDLSTLSLEQFMSKDVYSILLDRMLSHFVNEDLIFSLKDMVSGLLQNLSGVPNMVVGALGFNGSCLDGAAQYLIDTILYNLYPDNDSNGYGDYPYNGEIYDNALDYVLAIVNNILDFSYGDDTIQSNVNPTNAGKLDIRQIAAFIMTSHAVGCEVSFDETYQSIDAQYSEVECGDNHYAYMLPTDKTYRKRMLAALNDMDEQMRSGKLVEELINALLNPLFINEDSLLKTLFNYNFDFSNAVDDYLSESDYQRLKTGLAGIVDKIKMPLIQNLLGNFGIELTLPEDFTIDADNFQLKEIVNTLLPAIKPIVGDLFGFNFEGDDIFTIVQDLLDGYLTESFYVGLGGIADEIVVAFATDVMADLKDNTDPSVPLTLQPYAEYRYADRDITYLSSINTMSAVDSAINPATQENGRLPSHVVSHFNTSDTTHQYEIKFYTREDVYGTFRLYDKDGNLLVDVSTTYLNALSDNYAQMSNFFDTTSSAQSGNISVNMLTQTKPQYVPLIDLGLAALTHAQVDYENADGDEIKYKYGERDNATTNSIIYWNVTTVSITGLEPDTLYQYDVLGNYLPSNQDELVYFSLADANDDDNYFTFKTSPMASVDEFTFLAIADIQGMIQGMYDDSFKAVNALLNDERTNNFDFILNAGDMCDNGKNFNQWGYALNTYKDLFANTSMIFTEGNHEDGSGSMTNFFNYYREKGEDEVEKNELSTEEEIVYYSFDYANAHFVVLNTNDADGNGLGADQLAWLESDLASANHAKWKFVLMHKSLFSGGSHSTDAEVVAMRDQLVPIFANNGVNIVFAGHDHTYTTTTLINADGVATKELKDGENYTGDGVMYITLGTMGTKFYNYGENADVTPKFDEDASVLETLTTQTFGMVKVSGDTITYTGYTYDAENDTIVVIDETVLSNNGVDLKTIITAVVLSVLGVALVTTITLVALKTNGKLGKKQKATDNTSAQEE